MSSDDGSSNDPEQPRREPDYGAAPNTMPGGGGEKISITEEQLQMIQRRCMEIQNLNIVPVSMQQ